MATRSKTTRLVPSGWPEDRLLPLLVAAVQDYAIFLLDVDGNVASWNLGAERIKGYRADEIIGQHSSCFYTEEDRGRGLPAELLARARHDGRVADQCWHVRKDGERFWADVVLTALRDQQQKLLGFAKVVRDLTEHRTAMQNERRLIRELALREAAEAEQRRTAFLSRASALLATTLDLEATLQNIAQLVVPMLGDNCVVDVVDPDGTVRRVAEASVDPVRQELLQRLRRFPSMLHNGPVAASLRSGETQVIANFDEAVLASFSPGDEFSEIVRRIAPKASVTVPMKLEGRTLGAITFGVNSELRRPSREDIALAEELARRAALSLDNARAHAEARAQRDRLHTLFMQAPATVAIFHGPNHVVELANGIATALVGNREVVGKPFREAVPEVADTGIFALLDNIYASGETLAATEFGAKLDRGDGKLTESYFNFVFQPTRDPHSGKIDGLMVHAVEVTETVQARKRVESLAGDLQKTAAELERALKSRDEFITIASHELKTPLTPLQLQVQGLRRILQREGWSSALDERLDTVERQVGRLTVLVNHLLDISRITSGKLDLTLEDLDLAAVLREVIMRDREALERAGCTVELHAPAHLVARLDRLRVDQVITNLLSNACKYGLGKPVWISLEATGGQAVLTVRDQGMGIAAEDHERIFQRFERASSARPFAGFGLGLWISAQIVRALGGSISVDSTPGEGALFRVVLPVEAHVQSAPPTVH